MIEIVINLGKPEEFFTKEGIKKKLKTLELMIKSEKNPKILSKLKNLEAFLKEWVYDGKEKEGWRWADLEAKRLKINAFLSYPVLNKIILS